MWPERRIIGLCGIEHPILLAPMAGPSTAELAIAVAEDGGLGALATATSSPEQIRKDLGVIRQRTAKPVNLNFFTHTPPAPDPPRESRREGGAPRLLSGARHRSRQTRAVRQPRRDDLCHRRGIQAGDRELS